MAGGRNDGMTGYAAAREAAAWADVSARGRLKVTGADRARFLHKQCTNDIKRLQPGEGCYAVCLTSQGRMRGDFVARVCQDHILLDTEAPLREPLAAGFRRWIIREDVRIEDITEATGMLRVGGRGRGEVVSAVVATYDRRIDWRPLAVRDRRCGYGHFAAGDLTIAESFRTGLGDVDVIGPRERIAALKACLAKWAPEMSAETLDTLRVEAGIPVFGVDMDENTIPNEVGLEARAISYQKGCYIGQETMARIKSRGHVNRHWIGVRLETDDCGRSLGAPARGGLPIPAVGAPGPLPPRAKILAADVEIGYITSAVVSPRLGAIALGYVRRGHEQPGTRVVVAGHAATISGLPFES